MSILRDFTGIAEDTVELPDNAVFKELLALFREKYEGKLPKELYYDGEFKMIHIMFNKRDVNFKDDLEKPLSDGDIFYLIPPIGGG